MTFLNPAFLFGLFAASIPVLIHLFNLRKLKKVEFSTLIFLKELQKNKIRKVKLKQWLLLLLRTLIILFLVFAFARPTMKTTILGNSSTAKTTAVFILDDTYSMSVLDAKGSYLNQEKETALRLLSQLVDGDEAVVVLVSDWKNQTLPLATTDFSALKKSIEDLSFSYSSGTLQTAIIRAVKILDRSSNYSKELYILSDFQKSRMKDDEPYPDLSEALKKGTRIYAFPFGGKDVQNTGIDNITVNSQIIETGKPIDVSASITNYGTTPVENSVVSLFVNGERTSQKSFSLSAGQTKEISLEGTIKKTGYQEISAALEDDEIIQDDKRFAEIFVPEKIPVLVLTEEMSDALFIQLGLEAANTNQQLAVTTKQFSQLASTDVTQYAVVILIGVPAANPASLMQFVISGKGIFFFPGSTTSLQQFQNFSNAFGLPKPQNVSVGSQYHFQSVDYEHPLFKRLFEEKQKPSIESPEISASFLLRTEGKGKSIISISNGYTFLSEYEIGKGRMFVASSAPVLTQTNFPVKGVFAPLLYESVLYLSSLQKNGEEKITGDYLNVPVKENSGSQITVTKPGSGKEYYSIDDKMNSFLYQHADKPGIYYFSTVTKTTDVFTVNNNPKESNPKDANEEELKDYFNAVKSASQLTFIQKDENPELKIKQARFGTELWKYFLLFALLCALLEMWISKSSKKDIASFKQ